MPQLEQNSMALQHQQPSSKKGDLLSTLGVLQQLIDLQINKLKQLRIEKEKESRSELISSETNALEGKLMKVFAKQIDAKIRNGPGLSQDSSFQAIRSFPKLKDFLYVVDIEDDMEKEISQRCSSVEELFMFSDEKLRGIFYNHDDNEETTRRLNAQYQRLSMARNILQTYVFRLQNGEKQTGLQWSSWFETVPESPSANIRSSIASYLSVFSYSGEEVIKSRSIPPSPSPGRSFSTIPRSKSDEANIGQRVKTESTSSASSIGSNNRHRVKSESKVKHRPLDLTITPSTDGETDSEHSKSRSSSMSQSPRTPNANMKFWMKHSIKHRFSSKQLLVSIACGYCNRVMIFGLKCKECGFKCHKKCSKKAPPSCGLPDDLLKVFQDTVESSGHSVVEGLVPMKRTNSEPSDFENRVRSDKHMPKNRSHGSLPHQVIRDQSVAVVADSCSTASSTSSMSSSPFHSDSPLGTPNLTNHIDPSKEENFPFFTDNGDGEGIDINDLTSTQSTVNSEASTDTLIDTEYSKSSSDTTKSSSTLSIHGDDGNTTVDDLQLQISDVPTTVRFRVHPSTPLTKQEKIKRLMSVHNHGGSLMSEWVIPYHDIEQGDLIGHGRLGKVYKAKWHGEVALKVLYLENPTMEEKTEFRDKVQVLRRTRHENLILFMGACMEPPTLAIVTSLCKGSTLYQHIHLYRTKFDDIKLISIVQQIAQAMSYLHARQIVHRDLKTKNIFLENNRIVITDFGLISMADVKVTNERPNYLLLPQGWLAYQAPEIVRKLSAYDPGCEVPFYTKETDIYAFGGVWFELLAGMWPFARHPVEAVIWQIGKGVKQPLNGLDITREAKDILSLVWAHDPENRPQFSMLLKAFERLPKKKLIRSPSQPTYLTRSAEALLPL